MSAAQCHGPSATSCGSQSPSPSSASSATTERADQSFQSSISDFVTAKWTTRSRTTSEHHFGNRRAIVLQGWTRKQKDPTNKLCLTNVPACGTSERKLRHNTKSFSPHAKAVVNTGRTREVQPVRMLFLDEGGSETIFSFYDAIVCRL